MLPRRLRCRQNPGKPGGQENHRNAKQAIGKSQANSPPWPAPISSFILTIQAGWRDEKTLQPAFYLGFSFQPRRSTWECPRGLRSQDPDRLILRRNLQAIAVGWNSEWKSAEEAVGYEVELWTAFVPEIYISLFCFQCSKSEYDLCMESSKSSSIPFTNLASQEIGTVP